MELNLSGRVVLVTGGSKGIGLACAEAFAAEGARVAIVSRGRDNLAQAEKSLSGKGHRVLAVQGDLGDPAAAIAAVSAVERDLGPVDVLVNSAGSARSYAPQDIDAQAWHDAMNGKYFPYVHAMQAVLPGMAARRRGAIVNIIGQGGKVASATHLPGGSANAALMLVTAGLASVYGRSGIRVNAINPGSTLTDRARMRGQADARLRGVSEEEAHRQNAERIPLGRAARPEEIAAMTVFLASDRASYVTGANIPMDGGTAATVV